ncbi:MAG TPA: glutamine amidotransferase [Chloroflexota bacterium]|nr:glutamine amidotransferase [Chloroflexota bacterium]
MADSSLQLTLVHLYPDLMNVYGDRGNIIALQRRCAWRGIELCVQPVSLGDRLNSEECDLVFFGGGQDREQAVISPDFVTHKGAAVRDAVEAGAVVLAVCGGYQLLGHTYTTFDGQELAGVGVFDARSVPGSRRSIGNIVVQSDLGGRPLTLVGFENHSGRTYLGPRCRPLGRVLSGGGNNGEDGTEGAVYRDAYGCYMHGSLLPKNPWFADHLIDRAFRRRYGPDLTLQPLDDTLEERAHAAVVQRAQRLGSVRSGAW